MKPEIFDKMFGRIGMSGDFLNREIFIKEVCGKTNKATGRFNFGYGIEPLCIYKMLVHNNAHGYKQFNKITTVMFFKNFTMVRVCVFYGQGLYKSDAGMYRYRIIRTNDDIDAYEEEVTNITMVMA